MLATTLALFIVGSAFCQTPLDQLVPASAKGFITIPDVTQFEQNWEKIALSDLFEEKALEPFVNSLESQLNRSFATTDLRFGFGLTDFQKVCAGEACMAFLQPNDEAQKHAIATLAYTTGRDAEVEALLTSVDKNMARRGAERSNKKIGDVPATVYTVPLKKGSKQTFQTIIMLYNDVMVATDHIEVAQQIVVNLTNPGSKSISKVVPYQETMKRCLSETNGFTPDVRFYAEPLGYAELAREYVIKKKRRRTDLLASLKNQGFEALQGIGGLVSMAAGEQDIWCNAYMYAPAVGVDGRRYNKAANMMAFPIKGDQEVQGWIPTRLGSFATARWDINRGYQYIGDLVDEVAGEPGFFQDLVNSLEHDPNGPRINLEKDIVNHLGERVTIITQTTKPITVSSERFLVAIELSNAKAMNAGLQKMLSEDPDVQKVEFNDHIIWEIVSDEEDYEIEEVEVGFGDLDSGFGDAEFGEEEEPPLLTNAAIAVVKDCFVVASHIEFVKEMIEFTPNDDGLDDDKDYLVIREKLKQIGDDPDVSFRLFTRVDREVEASYELIRTGKMPESEGIVGRILNRFLASDKDDTREAQIDGEEMPDFAVIQKYLGTLGAYIRTEENGWYLGGLALAPEGNPELQSARPALSTAAADDGAIGN